MEEKNLPHFVFMRRKQVLSERKSGAAAKIYINSSSDEDDLFARPWHLNMVNFYLPHLSLNILSFTPPKTCFF